MEFIELFCNGVAGRVWAYKTISPLGTGHLLSPKVLIEFTNYCIAASVPIQEVRRGYRPKVGKS